MIPDRLQNLAAGAHRAAYFAHMLMPGILRDMAAKGIRLDGPALTGAFARLANGERCSASVQIVRQAMEQMLPAERGFPHTVSNSFIWFNSVSVRAQEEGF